MGLLSAFISAIVDPSAQSRSELKGAVGEAEGNLAFALFLPAEYVRFENLMIPTSNGTTEIDHVIVSPYGIFVVECKNWRGAIYGKPEERYWTVCLGPRKSWPLNPLFQNRGHIFALSKALNLPERYFHSVVFFWSDFCEFKKPMPENVLRKGLCSHIKSKTKHLLSASEVREIVAELRLVAVPSTEEAKRAHVARLTAEFKKH